MTNILDNFNEWQAPNNWPVIKTIDMHTEGEPLRIFISGYPALEGATILERRRFAKENFDHIRTSLMWEPRGHADMYGCVITPAITDTADFGVLFLHNEGYSSMCGHGILAITKSVFELGFLPKKEPEAIVKIDTPSGLVTSFARIENGKVNSVYFHNVPSFVEELDAIVDIPEIGEVRYDLAFGGAYYAYVNASDVGLECTPKYFSQLVTKGMQIKRAVMKSRQFKHPFEEDLKFLYGTIFIGPPLDENNDSRNVCVFAEGEVDRSPTGTGVSGRMAIHYARSEVEIGQPMVIESIIGSKFTSRIFASTKFGSFDAIIPEVEGRSFITGQNEFVIDPDDPLKDGFILR
jgi:trans-L-3-hydroxyproline dehydratase